MIKRMLPLFICVLALLFMVHPAFACPVCGPPDKVTLSGPGLNPIALTDATSAFGMDTFFGTPAREAIPAPQVGAGYLITRYYKGDGSLPESYWTTGLDRLHYYPNPTAGHGYIYYDGPIGADPMEVATALGLNKLVGKWFVATPQEDAAVQGLFTKFGLTPVTAARSGAGAPLPKTGDDAPRTGWLVVLASGLLLSGGLLARRRLRG